MTTVVYHAQNVHAGKHDCGERDDATVDVIESKVVDKRPYPERRSKEQEKDGETMQVTDWCRRSALVFVVGRHGMVEAEREGSLLICSGTQLIDETSEGSPT